MLNGPLKFVQTECLFCKDSRDKVLFPSSLTETSFSSYSFSARRKRTRENYRIVMCEKCSLIRSDPIITEKIINELYAESQFIFSEEAGYAAETYRKLLAGMISKYGLETGSLLEIGCSTGFFLEKAREMGIPDVVGFEPSRDCFANAADSIKPFIINSVFQPNCLNGKMFDIACLFHVIDHLRDPLDVLCELWEKMRPGGHVLLVAHDVAGWSARILGRYSPIFDIEHIYLFSQKTIGKLLDKARFEPVETGSLHNVYPLGYWMRVAPLLNTLHGVTPSFIRQIPVGLKAGNLYALGKKRA